MSTPRHDDSLATLLARRNDLEAIGHLRRAWLRAPFLATAQELTAIDVLQDAATYLADREAYRRAHPTLVEGGK